MNRYCTKEGVANYLQISIDGVDELLDKRMPYVELPIEGDNIRFDLELVNEWLQKKVRRASARPTQNEKIFIAIMKSRGLVVEYEPKKFELVGGITYTPDFYCAQTDSWWEVSSTKPCYEKSLPKVLQLRKLHPGLKIFMVKPDGTPLNTLHPEENTWNNRKKEVVTKGK